MTGRGATQHGLLDRRLHRIGQLVAAAAEELDPVVGHRVVTGRDHDAEVGTGLGCEVGERGRRHDAGEQHLGAGTGQPGHHRGLEHLPAGAGVTPDDRDGTRGPVAVGEHSGSSTCHREGQLRREVGIRQTPNAVGPEETTQRAGQRLEYCGALRAFFRPYFLRSLTRASLVRKPAFFSAGRFSGSTRVSALVTPRRSAPACPVTPPPVILATTSNWFSAPRVTNGSLTSCWCTLFGKYTSSVRPLIVHWPEPGMMRTRAMASLRRPVPAA